MAKKLDAERIEQARHKGEKTGSRNEAVKREIQETIAKNRSGERKGHVIMPQKKEYAYQDAPKVRVAAYCRVSTAEEAQEGSFEMQVQHFQSVIDNNPNYELVKIYTDKGISGTSVGKRKGFQEMIEDACAGKIDLILTKSISRFGRNIVDILTTLRTLSDLNPPVAVNFESEGINTSDGRNKLIISILSALAELESQQKSIAIKEGIRYRMQEGLYKYSVKNTIGYYRDYSGRVKIEPAEAEIVRYIFDSFTEGAPLHGKLQNLSRSKGYALRRVWNIGGRLQLKAFLGMKNTAAMFVTKKPIPKTTSLTKRRKIIIFCRSGIGKMTIPLSSNGRNGTGHRNCSKPETGEGAVSRWLL